MNKPFSYKGTNYTIIDVKGDMITFTSDINIYTFDRTTGEGVFNTGNALFRLSTGFNPKYFSPTIYMMDTIYITLNSKEYVGKAFSVVSSHYSPDDVFYVSSEVKFGQDINNLTGLLITKDIVYKSTLCKTEMGHEIDTITFLKGVKRVLKLLFNDENLSKQLFKEL